MRSLCPNVWILAPGVGAQGGDLDDTIHAAIRNDGMGIVIPISRGISRAEDPHEAALKYRDQINASVERVLAERAASPAVALNEKDSSPGAVGPGARARFPARCTARSSRR